MPAGRAPRPRRSGWRARPWGSIVAGHRETPGEILDRNHTEGTARTDQDRACAGHDAAPQPASQRRQPAAAVHHRLGPVGKYAGATRSDGHRRDLHSPETFVLGDIIESWSRLQALLWREKVWLFCAHFEKHPQFADFGLVNLNDFAAEALGLTDRSLPALIAAFYRHLARADHSGASRWGDKTPYNTFHLPALRAAFPDAQFLWLVRDGRDAACPMSRRVFTMISRPPRRAGSMRTGPAKASRRPGRTCFASPTRRS